MHETAKDLARLQDLLDDSYASAGAHLRDIITPERRLTAVQLADRLRGMCLLVLTSVTADARPVSGPVDAFFYRGAWYFGSADGSLRFRHLRRRPAVSAVYLPAEELSVTAHGRAHEVNIASVDGGGLRDVMAEYYASRFEGGESFVGSPGTAYARIDAERMFTFYLDPALAAS